MLWFVAAAFAATSVERSLDASRDAAVTLSAPCGTVRVTGGDRAGVRITGTIADERDFSAEVVAGRVRVDVSGHDPHEPGCVDLLVELPAGANVEVEGISTSFTFDGVTGEIEAETVSGDLTVTGAPRSVEAESVSGAVTVKGAAQDAELASVSGAVVAEGVGGELSAETVSGSVTVTAGSPLAEVELSAVSGDVTFSGALAPAGRLEAATHSGRLRIRLPADTDAALSQSSFSGRIRDVFGRGDELVLGQGKGRIELSTFSGDIEVEHR